MKTIISITYVIATICPLNSPLRASELSEAIEADYGRLDTLFRHFHANPELSMQEFKTSERLGDELEALGFAVTRNINETGLIGTMSNGEGPSLVIRADMDCLPVQENSDLVNIDPPIPSVYFEVGGTPPELIESGTWGPHHSPLFKIDSEVSIKAGVEAMTLAAMELLGDP